MRKMLDLCSGLGGASEAFVHDPEWQVVRIENNPLLKDVLSTTIVDLFEWDFKAYPIGYFDLIWASPPCTEFSTAYAAPRSVAAREGREFHPSMEIVNKCLEIIEYFSPKYWVMENVSGASKFISETVGKPARQVVGPFLLWGYFPYLSLPAGWSHSKADGDTWSTDPLRANRRGMVPLEVSERLRLAVTQQRTLQEWIS